MNDIDRDWFRIWTKGRYPNLIREVGTVLSLYSPYFLDEGEEENGPYTAGVTLGVFKNVGKGGKEFNNLILLSLFPRTRLNPDEVVRHAQNLCIDYLNNDCKKCYEGSSPDILIIPSVLGTRNTIFSDIRDNIGEVPMRFFYYSDYGKSLENLVKRALPRIIQGKVWVVSKPDSKERELRNMDERFLDILSSYPSTESRATVWSLAQAIVYLDRNGIFEEEKSPVIIKPKHGFYGGDVG